MTSTAGAPVRDRRATILAAAAELFAHKGYAATGVDEIGARAGITGPAIYRHFKGKDALLHAVVTTALEAYDLPDDTVAAGLEAMVRHSVSVAIDDPAPLATYLRERHRCRGGSLSEIEQIEHRLFRPWRDAIRTAAPTASDEDVPRRHRAVFAALSATASRGSSTPRADLERLLVASMVAVLSLPAMPRSPRRAAPSSWSLAPSKRDAILAAAMQLFRRRGFHDVSMDDIGDAVGITGPTIYFHYSSKLDVLTAAHERASVRTWVAVHDAIRDATSASDALDRLAGAQLAVAGDHSDLIVVTSREIAVPDPSDRERFEVRAHEIVGIWIAVLGELRPDLGPSELRAVITGVFPVMNQTAYALDRSSDGVAAVRAWALGSTDG